MESNKCSMPNPLGLDEKDFETVRQMMEKWSPEVVGQSYAVCLTLAMWLECMAYSLSLQDGASKSKGDCLMVCSKIHHALKAYILAEEIDTGSGKATV